MTTAFLLLAAFSAGLIDAIAGGGGLIQLPSLLAAYPNKETVELLGTNKVAANLGTTAAAINYQRSFRSSLSMLVALAIPAFIGSSVGALLATSIPTAAFKPIILMVLVFVVIYTWRRPQMGAIESFKHHPRLRTQIGALCAFVIGFYDGVIGPGTGSFLVLAFVAILGYAFLQASAMAKVVNIFTNLGAIVVFGFHGAIMWGLGLMMGLANIIGGVIGSRMALKGGSQLVRKVFLSVTSLLILKIAFDIVSA